MLETFTTNKHYNTIDYYYKEKYGKKVFKVPLNASFTCPNRDGSKGVGGCIFCSSLGSGDFAGKASKPLLEQFNDVAKIMNNKWQDGYKIAYFQAFSNTYGSISKLKETFDQFINFKDIIGISIATRCDCINEENVNYLKELSAHFQEFYVELGLQSANLKTMNLLNLKYTYTDFAKAVNLLHKANIKVICHIIDGLPYETSNDMLKTIKKINKLPISGIKIHILNIISNTKLANLYIKEKFKILSEDEFVDIACKQIASLKEDIIIHRIGADSNINDLIAPLWVRNKLAIVDKIDLKLEELGIFQGDLA